jgi:hypothetical protein
MSEISEINIPYEELKSLVISCLPNSVGSAAVQKELVKNPNPPGFQGVYYSLNQSDRNKVRSIIWNLILEQVLTIGDFHSDTWPHLSVTEYGSKITSSKQAVPNDPSGYISRIRNEIPDLDPIIEVYLTESIKTYNINQLLSATITLGCASEKALLILIDSFGDSFSDPSMKLAFLKKLEGKFIKTQFEEFDRAIKRVLPAFPYSLRDKYTNTLIGVFEMIRSNRNGAGHPTGRLVDKETLFANLQVFITYCKYIYQLKTHLDTEKHD